MYLEYFSLIFLFIPITYGISGHELCVKSTNCTCNYNDGTGYNLKEYFDSTPGGFLELPLKNLSVLYFHPCSNVPKLAGCNDSSLCLYNNTVYQNLVATDVLFVPIPPDEDYYQLKITTPALVLDIDLVCVNRNSINQLALQSETSNNLKLSFFSPYACRRELGADTGASTGTVLILIFLIIAFIYFVGGAIALYFLRGARGREMIPHVDFWTNLPSLVRDGVLFLQNGCKVPTSGPNVYDQI